MKENVSECFFSEHSVFPLMGLFVKHFITEYRQFPSWR